MFGVLGRVDRAFGEGVPSGRLEQRVPLVHDLNHAVAYGARARVQLGRDGCEETAAVKDVVLDVSQEVLGELLQPLEPGRGGRRGPTTSSANTVLAASIVASWSSSLEPKWAKSPLLLIPTASASRPIESPSRPSIVASWAASRRIAARLRSPSLRLLREVRSGS